MYYNEDNDKNASLQYSLKESFYSRWQKYKYGVGSLYIL